MYPCHTVKLCRPCIMLKSDTQLKFNFYSHSTCFIRAAV